MQSTMPTGSVRYTENTKYEGCDCRLPRRTSTMQLDTINPRVQGIAKECFRSSESQLTGFELLGGILTLIPAVIIMSPVLIPMSPFLAIYSYWQSSTENERVTGLANEFLHYNPNAQDAEVINYIKNELPQFEGYRCNSCDYDPS